MRYYFVRLAVAVSIALIVNTAPTSLRAEPNTLRLPEATISSVNNILQITRVPTVNGRGQVIYHDITIEFDVRNNGNVRVPQNNISVTRSPRILSTALEPGRYRAANGRIYTISSAGLTAGGRAIWSFTEPTCIDLVMIGGPVDGHPTIEERLKAARITNEALTYGAIGSASTVASCLGSTFNIFNYLVGMQMTPQHLVLNGFTNNSGDQSVPRRTITLSRCSVTQDCD